MFTSDDINARIKDRPFVPLRIIISGGQTFDVYHPDLLMIGRRALIVGRASTEDPAQFEQVTRLAIMHIIGLEDLPIPALPSGNGQT